MPTALVDRLALDWKLEPDTHELLEFMANDSLYRLRRPSNRPILTRREIADVGDLKEFVGTASQRAFQASYLLAQPDLTYIYAVLVEEIFEQ